MTRVTNSAVELAQRLVTKAEFVGDRHALEKGISDVLSLDTDSDPILSIAFQPVDIRNQLTDPRFYAEMSELLDDLIQQSRIDTASYEKFLKQAEALVKRLARKQPAAGIPAVLHGKPEAIVLFNNLPTLPASTFLYPVPEEERARLALALDVAVREGAPAGWKSDSEGPRGIQVMNALYPLLSRDRTATKAMYEIIKNQPGY